MSQNWQINDLGKDANKENCLQGAELMEIHFKGKAWHKPQLGLPEPEFRSVTVVTPAWSSGRLTHQKWAKKYFKYYAKDKVFANSSANFSATRARQSKYGLMRKCLGLDNWHLCWFRAATKFDQPGFCDLKICANFGLWAEYLTHGLVFVKMLMMPLSTLMDSESVNIQKAMRERKKKNACVQNTQC